MLTKLINFDFSEFKNKITESLKNDGTEIILKKTIFGLTKEYLLKNYGLCVALLVLLHFTPGLEEYHGISGYSFIIASSLLFPYARYAYLYFVDVFFGKDLMTNNVIMFVLGKIFFMYVCLTFSLFLAPIGLFILYIVNSTPQVEQEAQEVQTEQAE